MNDTILRALMQLVALVAQYNRSQLHSNANVLIKTYLEQSQGRYNVHLHLKQFYDFFQTFLSEQSTLSSNKSEGIDEYKVRSLCRQLTSELQANERIVLFFSFLDLINIDRRVTEEENHFTDILAEEFKIDALDYKNATELIYSETPIGLTKEDHLVISDMEVFQAEELEGSWITEHNPLPDRFNGSIHRAGLKGKIYVLRIKNANFFVVRYLGTDTVFINKKKLIPGKFSTFHLNDQFRFSTNLKPITYYEITSFFRLENNYLKLVLNGCDFAVNANHKQTTPIIHPFSFSEESGQLISVIGPAKTTNALFRVFTAYSYSFEGQLSLNNYDYATEHFKLSKLLGYIPEKPIYQADISIEKNLYLIARLHFPSYSETMLQQTIDEILHKCHLQDIRKIIPAKANGFLSEMHIRLINLSVELIRKPLLIVIENVLDGISASDAALILEILRREVDTGSLIFISTRHLSSSLMNYTDRLWLFDDQGFMIFQGDSDEILPYFQSFQTNFSGAKDKCPYCGTLNPDMISQIVQQKVLNTHGKFTLQRKITPVEWNLHYKEKIEKKKAFKDSKKVLPIHPGNIPNIDIQYYVFSIKTYLSNFTRIRENLFKLLATPVLAVILSFIFKNDWGTNYHFGQNPNISLFFILSILFHFLTGFIFGDHESRNDKELLEHHLPKNMSYFSYVNAKITWLFPFVFLNSLMFTAISVWILCIHGLFLKLWLINFTISCLSCLLGILCFNLGKTWLKSYLLFAGYLVFSIVFSGCLIKFDQLPKNLSDYRYVPVVAEFSPVRWAYEALAVDQVKNNPYESHFFTVEKEMTQAKFNANHLIPAMQSIILQFDKMTTGQKEMVQVIKNELHTMTKSYADVYPFEFQRLLTIEGVNHKVLEETTDYLTYLQMHFFDKIRELTGLRSKIETHLMDSLGKERFTQLKNDYFNNFLFEEQSRPQENEKVIVEKMGIVKVMNPIFQLPESNLGRAHYFSPMKLFNTYYYETIWFNLFVLWVLIFIAYLIVLISFVKIRPK